MKRISVFRSRYRTLHTCTPCTMPHPPRDYMPPLSEKPPGMSSLLHPLASHSAPAPPPNYLFHGHYSPEKVDLSLTRWDGDVTLLDCIQYPWRCRLSNSDSDTASTSGSFNYPLTLERKDSSSSLITLQIPAQPAVSTPSPIPESPICEASALSPDPAPALPKGPSPLFGEVISAEGTESARGPTPVPSVPEEVPAPPPAQPIPTLVVNDPTDSAPSVFTDEPKELSVPVSYTRMVA